VAGSSHGDEGELGSQLVSDAHQCESYSLFFLRNSSTAEDVTLNCFEHLKRSEVALGDAQELLLNFLF